MLIRFKVNSIKDAQAVKQIERRLLRVNGVDHLIVNPGNKMVKLIFDRQKTSLEVIFSALSEIGYTPEVD